MRKVRMSFAFVNLKKFLARKDDQLLVCAAILGMYDSSLPTCFKPEPSPVGVGVVVRAEGFFMT